MKNIFAIAAALMLASNTEAIQIKNLEEEEEETSQIKIDVLEQGNGELCQTDQTAAVHYTGALKSNGQVFDSSIPRGEPIKFKIGDFRVINCWEQAILQLSVGEKADVTCPAKTAYGQRSKPNIPANSDLTFNVEVVSCNA